MKTKQKGFTLIETLMVIAILGGMMVLALNYGTRQVTQQRRDKTALQMQQILNASLAYYTAYGTWPVPGGKCNFSSKSTNNSTAPSPLTTLTDAGFFPSAISTNAFGFPYGVACDSVTGGVFYVITQLDTKANALVIAGELPVSYLSDKYGNPDDDDLYVTSQVTTPGQNLNNARSVNFAGVYHHGACVPVPACPGYDVKANTSGPGACYSGTNCMVPQIMVAPASVSGLQDAYGGAFTPTNTYPITSFTAYALGPKTYKTVPACPADNPSKTGCDWGPDGIPIGSKASPVGLYWRVCLQVATEKGIISNLPNNEEWGKYVSMIAMTRCTPPSEPFGSDFTVYSR